MTPRPLSFFSYFSGTPAPAACERRAGQGSGVTAASVARAAPGEMTAAGVSLALFLPRLPILPHVGGKSEWDEGCKSGHIGQFVLRLV
jgi:hypothetical protein